MLRLFALLVLATLAVNGFIQRVPTSRKSALHLKSKDLIYKSVRLTTNDNRQITVFYKPVNMRVDTIITAMGTEKYVDNAVLDYFKAKGLIFISERRKNEPLFKPTKFNAETCGQVRIPMYSRFLTTNNYKNIGTPELPMYVKIIDASVMKENLEENVMSRDELIEKGYGHESAYELMLAEEITHIRNNLVPRLQLDFLPDAPQWGRFVNISGECEEFTLADAAIAYRANYSHTIHPDPHFDYYPSEDTFVTRSDWDHLQKRELLHNVTKNQVPWPYFQQLPWFTRSPASHPVKHENPVLWVALNDLYVEDYKEYLSSLPYRHVYASPGWMVAADACRIAVSAHFGDCYDPAVQLPHGGNDHDLGRNMRFAEVGHPSTVPGGMVTRAPDWMKEVARSKPYSHKWSFSPDPPDPFELSARQLQEMDEEDAAAARGLMELGLRPEDLESTRRAVAREVDRILEEEQRQKKEKEQQLLGGESGDGMTKIGVERGEEEVAQITKEDQAALEARREILRHKLLRERELANAIADADEFDKEYGKARPRPVDRTKALETSITNRQKRPKFVGYKLRNAFVNEPLDYNIVNYDDTLPKELKDGEGSFMNSTSVPYVQKVMLRTKVVKRMGQFKPARRRRS